MENIKFYNVQIGTYTRKGNYLENVSFICQSESNKDEIRRHYSDKYFGFTVNVLPITEKVTLNIEKEIIDNTSVFEKEIIELKKQLNEKQNVNKIEQIKMGIHYTNISAKFIEKRAELNKYYETLVKCKTELTEILIEFLKEKHKPYARRIDINSDSNVRDTEIKYNVILNGTLQTVFQEQNKEPKL